MDLGLRSINRDQAGKRNPGFMTVLLSELSRCQQEMVLRSKSERKPERTNLGEFTAPNSRQV